VDQRKAEVAFRVRERVTEAGTERGIADPANVGILEVEKAVPQTFAEATAAVTASLQSNQICEENALEYQGFVGKAVPVDLRRLPLPFGLPGP
jgi:hypothetical protein